MVHRHHLGTRMRDVALEVSLYRDPMPQASSAALAAMLLGRVTSPSNAAIRAEQILQVQEAVNSLEPLDREVVALRHFEQLTRAETAVVLVEHNLDLVTAAADTVTVLHHGRILATGSPHQIAADPTVREVYLGSPIEAVG